MNLVTTKKLALCTLSGALLAMSGGAYAHTRLATPVIEENAASHGSNLNNEVIAHGCRDPETGNADIDTYGTVVVFPDGVDSTITVDDEEYEGDLIDFVTNWGSPVSKIQDKDVFDTEDEIKDPNGNVVGFWSAGMPKLKGGLTGYIPFRTSGVVINEESCAKSVKFIVSIADVCELTPVSGFTDETAMLWVPAVGSNYDVEGLNGYDSPASLTVMRSITELPESCGEGVEVVVTPSAEQLNRDFPVVIDGKQWWPVPE